VTAHRYPPPPGARLPRRTRALAWWAGVGQPVWCRWARRVDAAVLFVMPLLCMAALLLTVLAQERPAPTVGSCTLVGSSWSCTLPEGTTS
jgi:hypothetical protein